ncbi:unnamed protein product [Brachionus calyciflorus]|uniref:Saposin B-type domain-containing protein n=1 Tax=Brachionus calyciflorus TaxID=104777 RepID=A0A814BBG5_9BILA|nr:unnamed protein product [Brachionus calyciflorus]
MIKIIISIFFCLAIAVNANQSIPESETNSPTCDICTLVLRTAQNLLEQNRTEDSIIKFIENDVCNKLGALSGTCIQYVDAYGRVVLEELAQKISPADICKKIGLCGKKLDKLPHPDEIRTVKKASQSGTVCQICTVVMSAAQNLLEQNKTEDEILKFIEKDLCNRLGSLSAICTQYVQAYGKVILYELSQKLDPSIVCNHLGLCETKVVAQHPVLKKMSNSLNCTVCKLVFQQVANLLQNNATEEQILQVIETKLCNATGKMSELCKTVIDAYGPSIIKYLASGVDPEKLCELIGMCTASQKVTLGKLVKRDIALKTANIETPKVQETVFCTVCQYAVTFIESEVQKNSTEQAIISTLDRVCKLAPPSLKDQCDSIIETYGIYLINLLVEFGDPNKVCQAIKLC